MTITNIEVGRYAGDETSLDVIEQVLTQAGVEFIDENGGPGVRLRKRQLKKIRRRQRRKGFVEDFRDTAPRPRDPPKNQALKTRVIKTIAQPLNAACSTNGKPA